MNLQIKLRVLLAVAIYVPVACSSNPSSSSTPGFLVNEIAHIYIGPSTHGLCLTPDGSMILITTNGYGDYVKYINTENFLEIASVPVGNLPTDVCIDADGYRAYCSNYMDGTISVLSISDATVVTTINVGGYVDGLALSIDGSYLFAAINNDRRIAVIETSTYIIESTISLYGYPSKLCMSNSGDFLYTICNSPNPRVYKINTNSLTLEDSTILSSSGLNLQISYDDGTLYALDGYGLRIIDSNSMSVIESDYIEPASSGISIVEENLYVCGRLVSGNDANINIYDLISYDLLLKCNIEVIAKAIVCDPELNRVYISANSLLVLGQ
jgi:DNA-binding beta-propeller fold protein YncE